MKRPDGVTIIAVWKFLIGVIFGIGACLILASAAILIPQADDPAGQWILALALGTGVVACVALGVVNLIAGWGLLTLSEWARWLTIALAILGLFNIPVGTIISGAIMVYLLTPGVKEAFEPAS